MLMKYSTFILFFLTSWVISGNSLYAQKEILGEWHGLADLGVQKLRIGFSISMEGDALKASMISPDQGNAVFPVDTIRYKDKEIYLAVNSIGLNYKGDYKATGNVIVGEVTQNGSSYDVELGREEIGSAYHRPQTPKAPFPYSIEEVNFHNKDEDIKLSGTLSFPKGNKDVPVAVMITGSGPQDRDETIAGHKPFLVIADHLSRNGYACLRYDERGVGDSEGEYSMATSKDFARDAIAAVRFLEKQGFENIGLIGHSEGGLVAAMVASEYPVDFLISLAGTGVSGYDILYQQNFDISVAEGLDPEAAEENRRKFMEMADIVLKTENTELAEQNLHHYLDSTYKAESQVIPDFEEWKKNQISSINTRWMRYFMQHDPCEDWSKVTCPVLVLNGTKDLQVNKDLNFNAIKSCLIEAENMEFTMTALANQNHLFQESESGRISEYADIEQTISPKTLRLMSSWLDGYFVNK